MRNWSCAILFLSTMAHAKPYFEESEVPKVAESYFSMPTKIDPQGIQSSILENSFDVVRIRVDWDQTSDSYRFGSLVRESTGTAGLLLRSSREDSLGSFKARLVSRRTGAILSHDSIGTGAHFRKLTRALSFRFPIPAEPARFEFVAENPENGRMELVLQQDVDVPRKLKMQQSKFEPEVRILKLASVQPALRFNIYAEGYLASGRESFFRDAARVVEAVEKNGFDGMQNFEYRAVFQPSARQLGKAEELGLPVQPRDSALGLYYPYWDQFGRWYHVVYPTSEEKFRAAVASVAYDYVFALIDSGEYWGVGNYREFTAVPSRSFSFEYLVQHELGHYFGLNEEYNGGGPTELAFAPGIQEPWSQNISFLADPQSLKWKSHVLPATPLPTEKSNWSGGGPYGAYEGGYAETEPFGRSHIPGLSCTMDRASKFCPICVSALNARVRFDTGRN
jgi:hypothetical protein